jgi:hypothetical protein
VTIGGATGLQAVYDSALKGWVNNGGVTILSKSASTYCVKSVVGNATAYKNGPANDIVVNPPRRPARRLDSLEVRRARATAPFRSFQGRRHCR